MKNAERNERHMKDILLTWSCTGISSVAAILPAMIGKSSVSVHPCPMHGHFHLGRHKVEMSPGLAESPRAGGEVTLIVHSQAVRGREIQGEGKYDEKSQKNQSSW